MKKLIKVGKKGKIYPKILIGIDPGRAGAIACVMQESEDKFQLFRIEDIPIIKHVKKTRSRKTGRIKISTKSEIDIQKTIDVFTKLKKSCTMSKTTVKLEKIHGLPRDGGHRAFMFGYGYGVLKGILALLRFNVEDITIPSWKKKFAIDDKEDAIRVAYDNVDAIDVTLTQQNISKIRIDQAEAILIAIT